jgi:peptidoglycan/xylan/chitin deacetylase (PgdA/CDA1 family)
VLDLDRAVGLLDHRGRMPVGTAAITFDDGIGALYEHALPVLRDLRLPAAVFVVAKTLPTGTGVDWVSERPLPGPIPTLTLEQILEMQDAGVVFGSHSYAHHDLTTLSERECAQDLRDSRELLESVLGRPVPFLAYPKGRHNPLVRMLALRAGYTHAFALPETREVAGRFSIPRTGVYRGNGVRAVRVKAARPYLAVRSNPLVQWARQFADDARAQRGKAA